MPRRKPSLSLPVSLSLSHLRLPGTSTLSPVKLLYVSSPLCVNFANPETREEGATSVEAGVGLNDVALESSFP